MAVVFTPRAQDDSNEDSFVIGTVTGGDVDGPMPRYSISSETFRTDNIALAKKYTITVAGNVLATGSMLSAGARQTQLMASMNTILGLDGRLGKLEIIPYGGGEGIDFDDARVMSIDVPEQSEESGGTQFQEYSFTFEAFNALNSAAIAESPGDLQSMEESWETSYADVMTIVGTTDISPRRTMTMSHTVSAVGYSKTNTTMAYRNAQAWVDSRVKGPGFTEAHDPAGATSGQKVTLDTIGSGKAGRKATNYTKQVSQDLTGGSYSVTETWAASTFPYTVSVEVGVETSAEAEFNTATGAINIQGMYEGEDSAGKYGTAQNGFTVVKGKIRDKMMSISGLTLGTTAVSESETHNITDGTISYNVSYTDEQKDNPDAISESFSITDNNEDGLNEIVAIIPVLAKADGPVIQNMNTTNEKTRSVSYEITLIKEKRGSKPNYESYVTPYKPTSTTGGSVYRQSKTETWNPKSGTYSLSVDWVYT